MNSEQLKLENQLCFPLYAAAKGVLSKYTPMLNDIDLTYTQYIVMMLMWEHKIISFKELASKLYLDSGTLTPLLKRLENKGLVVRNRSKIDEREMNISITNKGTELKQLAQNIPLKMKKRLNLTNNEQDTLYNLLYKLLENK